MKDLLSNTLGIVTGILYIPIIIVALVILTAAIF